MANLGRLVAWIVAGSLALLTNSFVTQTEALATMERKGSQDSAETVTLTLWEHSKDEEQVLLDQLIRDFVAQHPGIAIKRSHYKTEDLRTQFQTAALAGGGADLVIAPGDFAGPFSVMGIVREIDPKVLGTERFFSQALASGQDDMGRLWGVPYSFGNHLMLFANRRLVREIPKTLEQMINAAKSIPVPLRQQVGLAYPLTEPFWLAPFVHGLGSTLLKESTPSLDTDGMRGALAAVRSFKFEHKIVPEDCDYGCADALFVEEKVGLILNGDWAVSKYREVLGPDLAIVPLPEPLSPFVSGKFVFLNRTLEGVRLDLAQSFALYLASPEVQRRLVREVLQLPAIATLEGESFWTEMAEMSVVLQAAAKGRPMPMSMAMRVVWDSMRPQLQEVMSGRSTPEDAARRMQSDAVARLRDLSH